MSRKIRESELPDKDKAPPSGSIPEWAHEMWKTEIREKYAIRNAGEGLANMLRYLDGLLSDRAYPHHENVAVALSEWSLVCAHPTATDTVSDEACTKAVKEVLG